MDAINRNIAVIGLVQVVFILGGQFVATFFISSNFSSDLTQAPDALVILSRYGFIFVIVPLLWGLVAAYFANTRRADGWRGVAICCAGVLLVMLVGGAVFRALFQHMIHIDM